MNGVMYRCRAIDTYYSQMSQFRHRLVCFVRIFGYIFMSQVTNVPPLISMRILDWDQRTEHSCA